MEDRIKEDLKQAQLSKDELKTSVLRMLLSEVNNQRIQKGSDLTDEEITSVFQKEVKKRKEAALAFKNGGRGDSAQKEEDEALILASYLPEQMSVEELTKIVEDTINELGANSQADMGKVIGSVIGKVKGQADGGEVSRLVREKLI